MRALIVDDSRAMRRILKHQLDRAGFTVFEVCNGREAIDWLANQPPVDIVLLDWHMPVMNGLECLRRLRAEVANQQTKILFVSVEDDRDRQMQALRLGANGFVCKPFLVSDLLERIQSLLPNPVDRPVVEPVVT